MLIYRPGAITPAMIELVAGPVRTFQPATAQPENPASLPSPGVGIRHYAPRARLILVASEAALHQQEEQLAAAGEKTGVLLPENWTAKPSTEVFPWAAWEDSEALAQRLFAGLRELDARGVTVILCPLPEANGVGLAIRDRLEKAARTR
jgi:L-threonylcarbamoyladenylate synthase